MAIDNVSMPTKQMTGVKKTPLIAVMIIGAFIAVLNETLMNVALTDIMAQLNVGASTAQWLTTAYMLTIGIFIPTTAFLMQKFTTRQLYITAMSLFALGTLIAGVSPNFSLLLIGRIIQAMGTGVILPLMSAVILSVIEPKKRGSVMGVLGVVILFAPAIGPTISGLIVEYLSWRMLFFTVLPIALFALVYSSIVLKNVMDLTNPKIDLVSIALSTLGFGGIVYGFSSAGKGGAGWSSAEVIIGLIVGFIGLILFVIRQNKLNEPMLSMKPFTHKLFAIGAMIMTLSMMAMFSSMILLPMFLQEAINVSPLQAGVVMLPGGVIMGLMSPISGRLFDRFGAQWLARIGLIIVFSMLFTFGTVDHNVSLGSIIAIHSIMMFGISLLMMPVMTMSLNQLPSELYPHGSAILNTVQQVAGAIGTALLITIMSTRQESLIAKENLSTEIAMTSGVNAAFIFAGVTIVVAFVLSWFIRKK